MTSDYITPIESKEGYERIMKVVKRLLKTSQDHLKVGEYSNSIPLSILSLEETAKADYLHVANKRGNNISKEQWDNFTRGGKSHIVKLTYMLDKRQKFLEKWSENDIQVINNYNRKLGLAVNYPNKSAVKNDTDLFRNIAPKLKNLKEDCFYTSWIPHEKKWNYFDRRFPEHVKKLLANYLYLEAKKEYYSQLFFSIFQNNKMLVSYSAEEWNTIMLSPHREELVRTLDELAKCVRGKLSLIINSISSY